MDLYSKIQTIALIIFIPIWGYTTAMGTNLTADIILNTILIVFIVLWSYTVGRMHQMDSGSDTDG